MKKGFTLAEVLITLAIIGVVASLTIPIVVKNYQKTQTITRLKKVYTNLHQVIEMSEIDNGAVSGWDFTKSTQDFMSTYLIPYLKISKNCGVSGTDCWNGNYMYRPDGTVFESINSFNKVKLQDGTFLAIANQGIHVHIYADIDGYKGKSRYGKDVFIFTITPIAFSDYIHNVNKPGFYIFGSGMPRSTLLPYCKTDGIGCGALILLDGWQIKDDYPW